MRLRHFCGRKTVMYSGVPTGVLICLSALLASVMPALAWDWRIVADVVERVEADDNFRQREISAGNSYGSTTNITLDTTVQSPRSTLSVLGGARISEFGGPGADSDINTFDQNVSGTYSIRGPRSTLSLNGRLDRDSSTFTDFDVVNFGGFDQTIVTEGEADRFSYSFGGTYSISVDPRNTLSFFADQSNIDFSQNVLGLTPTTTTTIGGSWNTVIAPNASFLLSSSLSWFEADSAEEREVETIAVSGRITGEVIPGLTIYGEGGINFFDTSSLIAGARQSATSIGNTFDFGFTYVLGVTTLDASISQSVSSSNVGDLRQRTGITARLLHSINTISSFTMGGSIARQESATSSTSVGLGTTEANRDVARLYSHYSVELTEYWDLLLAYEFRWRGTDGVTTSTSNKIFGTLSREFVILP